jgi:hypothetical protein
VPGRTTVQEIRDFFAQAATFSSDGTRTEQDWIHPGRYCYSCDYGVLVTYAPPWPTSPVDERPFVLTLVSAGPNRAQVLSEVRRALGLSPQQVLELFKDDQPVVLERPSYAVAEVQGLLRIFSELGAVVTQHRKPPGDV